MSNSHGGARPGAGRPKMKPTEKRQLITFSISPETMKAFQKAVPPGDRARFIEAAILFKLRERLWQCLPLQTEATRLNPEAPRI